MLDKHTFMSHIAWLVSQIHLSHRHCVPASIELFGLESLAASLGVSVVLGMLPPGWWGAFRAYNRTITMRPGLKPAQFRSVLAHELGHAHHGHGFSDCRSKQERMADRFAASTLIRLDDYVMARARHGNDIAAIARELHVMQWVVREYAETMNGSMFARSGVGNYRPGELAIPRGMVVPHEMEAVCEDVMDVTSPVDSKVLILGNNVLR